MERLVDYKYSELIGAAFDILPVGIFERLKYTHFFTGTDPIFAGLIIPDIENLKAWGYDIETAINAYRNGACCSYAHNQHICKRQTTVILPKLRGIEYPIHELGHVLDEQMGWSHKAKPVTDYAKTNDMEAFAEAFASWLIPGYGNRIDEKTLRLFESL